MIRRLVLFAVLLLSGSVTLPIQIQQEEVADYYTKWLTEDVVYIITPEERDVFLNLQNEAERDHFIEQFWQRRDPDSRTSFNEFKEEHYRRIQYANEHFTAGMAGWRTDRGLIYIKYGPPDDIDDHPAGSTYVRPKHEGGGTTLVNPFQVWRYNYVEGVGMDIEIEFVDIHGGNLYRFADDELEKDALLYHPMLGLTISEQLLGGDKTERIITRSFGDLDAKLANQLARTPRAKDEPFERMRVLKELESAPEIQYQDLRRIVTTDIRYDNLPFDTRIALFLQDGMGRVPIGIVVPNSELTYETIPSGLGRAVLEIYGMVTTPSNRVVDEFESTLVRDRSNTSDTGNSIAQKVLRLPSGRYKLSLVVRDANSGKVGTGDFSLVVPVFAGSLSSSTLLLADKIEKAGAQEGGDPLVLSAGYKVIPNLKNTYRKGQDIQIYLELYNFALDQASSRPVLEVNTEIQKGGKHWVYSEQVLDRSLNHHELLRDRLLILKKLPTSDMESGDYRIVMRFEDQINKNVTVAASEFKVVP